MMRVKLVSEPELDQMGRTCREYDAVMFYDLLREKKEFTDPASELLLKILHGEESMTGKWYRGINAAGQAYLPAISPEAMYGLVVLENSRKGIYTVIQREFCEFETECRMREAIGGERDFPLVWDAFAAMKEDILLVFRKKDFTFAWDIPLDNDFLLENYTLNGVTTEVWVENKRFGSQPETTDGKLRVGNFFYDLQYRWNQDPEELVKTIDMENRFIPLAKGAMSEQEFLNVCDTRPYEVDGDPAWHVINHAEFCPDDADSRRIRYLIIENCADGSYCLSDEISVKYPSYTEMYEEVKYMAKKAKGEIFVLPVDVNEVLLEAADIQKAICAFRVAGNVIETFGPKEGLMEFRILLQTAIQSGTIDRTEEEED